MDRRLRVLVTVLLVLAVGLVLKLAQSVIIPLLLAFLLTYVMDPVAVALRRVVPHWLATALTALVFLAVLVGVGILALSNLVSLARGFPAYQDGFLSMVTTANDWLQTVIGTQLELDLFDQISSLPIPGLILGTARSTLSIAAGFGLIYLFAVLFLASKRHLPRKITRVLPPAALGQSEGRLISLATIRDIDTSLRRYMGIKTLISATIGAGTGVVVWLFGVSFPFVWGLLTFVLNFIPSLGSLIAIAVVFLFSLAQFGDLGYAVWILLVLLLLQLATGSVVEPALVGDTLDLSLLVVFVSLLFWGWLWGPAGILLAVPMTEVVKLTLKSLPSTARFVGLLESARPRRPLLRRRGRRGRAGRAEAPPPTARPRGW